MAAIVPALLALLQSLIPALGSTTAVGSIIATLTQIIPVAVKEVQDVTPMIRNIIEALKASPQTNLDQLVALREMSKTLDDAFEAAAAAATAEDAAAEQP